MLDHVPSTLFWHESNRLPLRITIAPNKNQAAKLLGVSPSNLHRKGGELKLTDDALEGLDPRLKDVVPNVLNTGGVYQFVNGRWRLTKTDVSASRIRKLADKGAKSRGRRKSKETAFVRTLKLTVLEEQSLRKAGGAAWLRREIESLPSPPPYSNDRSRAPKTKGGRLPISIRMSEKHWRLLLAVGGVRWIRERLIISDRN